VSFQTFGWRQRRETEVFDFGALLRLWVSFMLAFIPCPALGEWVWQASPAIKTRSRMENFDATR